MTLDVNDLAYWYPRINRAPGIKTPATEIIHTDAQLFDLLDGRLPDGYHQFLGDLNAAAERISPLAGADSRLAPVFLRTGHGSGKHSWSRTCWVADRNHLAAHVAELVQWSAMCDLPVTTWAVRARLPIQPLFICEAYRDLPVAREFRLFVEAGYVTHIQPYWPAAAIEQGRPDHPDWPALLEQAGRLTGAEWEQLRAMAITAVTAIGEGDWSVDFMQTVDGRWYLIDMAQAERSYRYEPDQMYAVR